MKTAVDQDLRFLEQIASPNLSPLVSVITLAGHSQEPQDSALTTDALYQQHVPDHHVYWERIAQQVQITGSDKLLGKFGGATPYAKIVDKAIKKANVPLLPDLAVESAERQFFMHVFMDAVRMISLTSLNEVGPLLGLESSVTEHDIFRRDIEQAARTTTRTRALIALSTAHAAAMYSCEIGYDRLIPESLHHLINLFERPLREIFNSFKSMTTSTTMRQVIIPMVAQIAFLRASCDVVILTEK